MDREWGHTEAINGVALIDGDETGQTVVSVGEDCMNDSGCPPTSKMQGLAHAALSISG